MPKRSKAAQTSFILKPGTIRQRRIFLHFFDIHLLKVRGSYMRDNRAQMEFAVRMAVILGEEILVPAASYYEASIAQEILRPFMESDLGSLFSLVGSGSSLEEFVGEKIDQYRPGSHQHAVYSSPLEQLAGWRRRSRSATKDIVTGWLTEAQSEEMLEEFSNYRPENVSEADFRRAWINVPERLGREAFIVDHVSDKLPVPETNIAVRNALHRRVNHHYFNSYAQDYGAAVFQNMSLSGGVLVPSGNPADDIDFRSLLKMSRVTGLLDKILSSPIENLETIVFDKQFEEVFSMSQTDGPADRVPLHPDRVECDLAILTALPKEREAVEAVFGEGKVFEVKNDPHVYKLIELEIGGRTRRIVVGVLSDMGNTRSGVTSANFLRSINARDVFFVGIAGGIPNMAVAREDVRLGDVVIGRSVLEADFIKRGPNGEIICRDSPQRLSFRVHQYANNAISELTGFDVRWLPIRDAAFKIYGIDPDKLPSDALLDDKKQEVVRPLDVRRDRSAKIVHFGRIAAGDTLLKDPVVRDQLRDQHGIMAVEMESAGLRDAGWANSVAVGVVRGIVDYCDGNKDDNWHMPAALSAAAVTRFLFERMVEAAR